MNRTFRPIAVYCAAVYFAGVFALAFALGIGRTLWLAPRIGPVGAVLCEVPVVLAASWWWARRLLIRHPLPSQGAALAMGALAFAILMLAECALAVLVFGQTPAIWAASLATRAGALGLAGQLGFAVMPWAVWQVQADSR